MEGKKIVIHNLNNLPTIDYRSLTILQGDLKTLSEKDKLKLCKSIIKHGFFVPAFVWRSKDTMYILDATQRYYSLEALEENGYSIPPIPYVEIPAKDKKDASEKLLQITSRYRKINPETGFFKDLDIELEYMDEIEIPELKIDFDTDFESFADIIKDFNENDPEGSSHAITFVFTEEDHKMIMAYIGKNSRNGIVDAIVRFCRGDTDA
jgi:hypothetical protein